mgnify:CR=1 FL=1
MPDSTRVATKVLGALQDLLVGEGKAQQSRAGATYTVDKIRLLYIANSLEELNALDPTMFPKALLVVNGSYSLRVFDGAMYQHVPQLPPVASLTDETTIDVTALETVVVTPTAPTIITGLSNGVNGQCVRLIATTANTTVENNSSIHLRGGVDLTLPINTGVSLVFIATVGWAEV